jgi:hypothetical protein
VLQLNNGKIYPSTGDRQKPEIITLYNLKKDGVDVVAEMCAAFSCARNTRSWPMVIFYSILNVAGMNAFIIFFPQQEQQNTEKNFPEGTKPGVVKEQLTIRATTSCLPREVQEKAPKLTEQPVPKEKHALGKRGRYQECVRKDRKTQRYCSNCFKFLS